MKTPSHTYYKLSNHYILNEKLFRLKSYEVYRHRQFTNIHIHTEVWHSDIKYILR